MSENSYDFIGYHLLANYTGCNPSAVSDIKTFRKKMRQAAVSSGATILKESSHNFDGNGFSMVLLLSESHASVHTYPEHNSCFIDLFTCGTTCKPEKFAQILREYLCPTGISETVAVRSNVTENIEDTLIPG
jgi:S-adenosylmethionine decarboxylase